MLRTVWCKHCHLGADPTNQLDVLLVLCANGQSDDLDTACFNNNLDIAAITHTLLKADTPSSALGGFNPICMHGKEEGVGWSAI